MARLLFLLCLFAIIPANAQPPVLELTSHGFEPVTATIPATPNDKLIEISRAWAAEANRRQKRGYDITEVTDSSMTISAFRKNAFFFRNNGEMFEYTIRYSMILNFSTSNYTLKFIVSDIYTSDDVLVKYKLPDYFASNGNLKEGYDDLKPSLERTVNELVTSYHDFIVNFR